MGDAAVVVVANEGHENLFSALDDVRKALGDLEGQAIVN